MARINVAERKPTLRTHEGARAAHITPEQELRRTVMACLLWEDTFYESGVSVADRIASLVKQVDPARVETIASEARNEMHLRHAPLLLARELVGNGWGVEFLLGDIIQRADEMAEFLALYWKDGKVPLDHSVRRGLDRAIRKFDEYQLAKYDRAGAVKLRDVFRIVRPKPEDETQAALWGRAVKGELATPDTWETASAHGKLDKDGWERLLGERRLGGMALLRNLRNMTQAGVTTDVLSHAIVNMRTDRILPFRFIAAARAVPSLEPAIEQAMLRSMADAEMMDGRTVLLIDVSGSMNSTISAKSDMTRMDAACGLAVLLARVCPQLRVFTFSDKVVEVPPRAVRRTGFALRDAVDNSQPHSGTYLGRAIESLRFAIDDETRFIVISDEQSRDVVTVKNVPGRKYMLNVASYQNGVGYGDWTHIDGWSDSVVNYIQHSER